MQMTLRGAKTNPAIMHAEGKSSESDDDSDQERASQAPMPGTQKAMRTTPGTSNLGAESSAPGSRSRARNSASQQEASATTTTTTSASAGPVPSAERIEQARCARNIWSQKSVADLKKLLSDKKLPVSGNKPDLIKRLVSADFPEVDYEGSIGIAQATSRVVKVESMLARSTEGWQLLPKGEDSSIMSEVDADTLIFGDFVGFFEARHYKVDQQLKLVSGLAPNATLGLKIFAMLADPIARTIIDATNVRGAVTITDKILGQTVGVALRCCLSSLSTDAKFELYKDELQTVNRKLYDTVLHNLTVISVKPASPQEAAQITGTNASHTPLRDLMREWEVLSRAIMQTTQRFMIPVNKVSIDDDLVNYAGKPDPHYRKTIIQREGEGQTIDTATSVVGGLVLASAVRAGAGVLSSVKPLLSSFGSAITSVSWDRGYANLTTTEEACSARVGSLGTVGDKSAAQLPFTTHNYARSANLPELRMRAANLGEFEMLSFPGAGDDVKVACKDRTVAVLVRQRRSGSREGGFTRLLIGLPFGPGAQYDNMLPHLTNLQKMASSFIYVREGVPRNVNLLQQPRSSYAAQSQTETRFLQHFASSHILIQTLISGDVSWFLSRIGRCTALAAAAVVPSIAKHNIAQYPAVSNYLCRPTSLGSAPQISITPLNELVGDDVTDDALFMESSSAGPVSPAIIESTLPNSSVGAAEIEAEDDADIDGLNRGEASETTMVGDASISQSDSASVDSSAAQGRDADLHALRQRCLERLVHLQLYSTFTGNEHTAEGHLSERRADMRLANMDFIVDGLVFKSGLILREEQPHLCASPDSFVLLDLTKIPHAAGALGDNQPVLALVEHKCSIHFQLPIGAEVLKSVHALSPNFWARVPSKFAVQLIHQAAVCSVQHSLFIRSTPHGLLDTTHVFFPLNLLQEYLVLGQSAIFKFLFPVAAALSDVDVSDAEVASLIPEAWPADFKYAMESQIPRLRALAKHRAALGQPLPPARSIKPYFVHEYNRTRGGTDGVGWLLSRAMNPGNLHLSLPTKITLRALYYQVNNAFRLLGMYRAWEKAATLSPQERRKLSLREMRLLASEATGTFPDFCDALGRELVLKGSGLGALVFAAAGATTMTPSAPSFATPAAPSIQVLAAKPVAALNLLKNRARRANREIDARDFFNGTLLPAADIMFSPTTPGNVVVEVGEYWTIKTAKVVQAFNSRPKRAHGERRSKDEAQRSARLVFWESDGSILRYNEYLLHEVVEESGRHSCLFCGKERARQGCSCVICGEFFCSKDCFMDFHRRGVEFKNPDKNDEEEGSHESSVSAAGASQATGPSAGAQSGSLVGGVAGGGAVGSIAFNLYLAEDEAEDDADDEALLAPTGLPSLEQIGISGRGRGGTGPDQGAGVSGRGGPGRGVQLRKR